MNQALYAHMNNKRKMKKNNNKIKYPTNKGENYEKKKSQYGWLPQLLQVCSKALFTVTFNLLKTEAKSKLLHPLSAVLFPYNLQS
jgi:hypothetical protein